MAGTATVSGCQTIVIGTATITSFVQQTPPSQGSYSLYDATNPGMTGLQCCLWPYNAVDGSGQKDVTQPPLGVFGLNGLVLMTPIVGDGVFVVGWM